MVKQEVAPRVELHEVDVGLVVSLLASVPFRAHYKLSKPSLADKIFNFLL